MHAKLLTRGLASYSWGLSLAVQGSTQSHPLSNRSCPPPPPPSFPHVPRGGFFSHYTDHAAGSGIFDKKEELLAHLHSMRSRPARRLRKQVVWEVFESKWLDSQEAEFVGVVADHREAEALEMELDAAGYAVRAGAQLPPTSQAAVNVHWRARGATAAAAAAAAAAEQPGHDGRFAGAEADRRGDKGRPTEQHRIRGWEDQRE